MIHKLANKNKSPTIKQDEYSLVQDKLNINTLLPNISPRQNKKSIVRYFNPAQTTMNLNSLKTPENIHLVNKEIEKRMKIAKYEKESLIDQLQKEVTYSKEKKKERGKFDSWLREAIQ